MNLRTIDSRTRGVGSMAFESVSVVWSDYVRGDTQRRVVGSQVRVVTTSRDT